MKSDAYKRGFRDGSREDVREPLWYETQSGKLVPALDDYMADEWSEESIRDYIRGYEYAMRCA